MRERVVITGLGAVCAAGASVTEVWDAIAAGKSAIAPIENWDTNDWPVRNAGEVRVADRALVADRKLHKIISRTDLLGLNAADQAIEASGLTKHRASLNEEAAAQFNDRTGVFAGSGGANYRSNHDFFPLLTAAGGNLRTFGQELTSAVNPMWLLRNLPNNVLCHVGIRHGFKGTNACVTNHSVSGVLALAEAAGAVRTGECERAVAVGHDAPVEPETLYYYHRLGLLSQDDVRPFDRRRAGTILGEGAAAVVLEKAEEAERREAKVCGEFLGFGCTTEASGVLELRPDGEGVRDAITRALEDAQLQPAEVGLIVAHGNGTINSDTSEVAALRDVFGEALPPITATKWAFGHLFAASGVMDVVLALLAWRENAVPAIPTLEEIDPALAPLPVSRETQIPRAPVALVICRGFGGMNVAVIVRGAKNP